MKLIIEPPTWLGDIVMSTGAIKALINKINPDEIVIFGNSFIKDIFNFECKKIVYKNKYIDLIKNMSYLRGDIAVSFRKHLFSKILVSFSKEGYVNDININAHQVEKYSYFVNKIIHEEQVYSPVLDMNPKKKTKLIAGINPGATYGSAKRWYPEEFAKVANEIGKIYDEVIIFGGPREEEIANDIEKHLRIKNYQNLCGKLNIKELCEYIGGLSLFITNDSGPMHIAAAFNVPIVAIFGPTDYTETHPWSNNYKIVTKNLDCAPCKKRECPLKHHNCMKEIKAEDVIKAIKELK